MMELLSSLGIDLSTFALSKIVGAAVILVVCLILVKIIMKMVTTLLERSNLDKTLFAFTEAALRVLLYVLTGIVTLGSLGFEVTSLVAALSVVGLAASLAMQNSLSNLAGGILLLVTKPFVVDDYVAAGGVEGTVMEVGLAYTKLATVDNKLVSVPNGTISSATITNYSTNGKRRVDQDYTVSYDSDVDLVKKAILEAIGKQPEIVNEPEPFVRISAYNDSNITYTVRVWAPTSAYWDVYFNLMEDVKRSFDANGVEMTYNHLNVHMIER